MDGLTDNRKNPGIILKDIRGQKCGDYPHKKHFLVKEVHNTLSVRVGAILTTTQANSLISSGWDVAIKGS